MHSGRANPQPPAPVLISSGSQSAHWSTIRHHHSKSRPSSGRVFLPVSPETHLPRERERSRIGGLDSVQAGIRTMMPHPIDEEAASFYTRFRFIASPLREQQLPPLLKDARCRVH